MLKKRSTALPRFPRAGTPPPSPDARQRNRAPCARRDGASPRDEAQATPAKARTPGCTPLSDRTTTSFGSVVLVAAQSSLTSSVGKNGVSAATVMTKRLSGRFDFAHVSPAWMPASGPIWPARLSGKSASPNCPKRAGSSLALSTISVTCGRRRATTWASNGRLPSGSNALSPPPMRLDLPPASTMPITPPDELMAVIVPRRGLHRLRRARRSARRAQAGGSAAT